MKKHLVFTGIIILTLVFSIVPEKPGSSAGTCPTPNLNYYTAYPPFITETATPPNVMIVLDNSGSMFRFAYFDGWTTDTAADDNSCYPSYCTGFTDPGTYPNFKYYGYFDPDYWYLYNSGRFYPTAPKTGSGLAGARDKTSSEWDGNFLNWLTMRRVDVIRKVLTGGLVVATGGEDRLITERADYYGRGIYKRITNAGNYTPYSGTGNAYFIFSTGSSNPSRFWVSEYSDFRTYDYRYVRALTVGGATPAGIVQNMWTSVRWGLSYYYPNCPSGWGCSTNQGGYVDASVGKISQSSFVNKINNKRPDSNTPLGETLWTDVGYFAQIASWLGGPGPRYQSGDYTINNNNDPYNYGTGGSPLYVKCAKSFVLYITDGEPCADGYLPGTLSDYAGTAGSPYNCTGSSCPAVGSFPASTLPSCSAGGNVAGIEDVALYAHTNDIRTSETKDIEDTQTLTIYTVFAFGKGSTLLKYAAINGGFIDSNENNLPDLQSEWDKKINSTGADGSDGLPDTYFEATEGYALESSLLIALNSILNRSSSGSAASVLATTGEGEGAVYQAYFIPGTPGASATEANWRGYLHGLFLDKYGNLREDTNGNATLDYISDYIVSMYFDTTLTPAQTMVERWQDTDGDGQPDNQILPNVELKDVIPIWEAGKVLWTTNPSSRTIYTTIDGSTFLTNNFTITNASDLRPYLRASDYTEAVKIINYIRGTDQTGYRTRTYTKDGTTDTWKLGDIIYSSPTLVARPAENLDLIYADSTYAAFIQKYTSRRHVVYAGANDGMLHAFNAGFYSPDDPRYCDIWSDSNSNGRIDSGECSGFSELGKELWAFIPRELLPHLKWLTDPNYTHVYYVDLKPKVVDVRIFNPDDTHPYGWGTILIGGMRFGGKEVCVSDNFGSGPEERTFRSAYFALDITDPEQPPRLLWTFTHPDLPLTTSYPAVLRTGPRDEAGTYHVIFGSGPTDYDGTSEQTGRVFALKISGSSNGVISTWTAGSNYWESGVDFLIGGTTIDNYAFMADSAVIDVGLDYKADVIYIGDTYCDSPIDSLDPSKCSSSNWKGKMYRIATKPDVDSPPSTDPANWKLSVMLDAEQPISSSPNAAMDERNNLWVFFGTGRFWHTDDRALDGTESWTFYGIKDTCKPWYDPNSTECNNPIIRNSETGEFDDLYNSTSIDVCLGGDTTSCSPLYGTPNLWGTIIANAAAQKGWYLNLPTAGERALSRPLVLGGLVAWTSYKPNPDDPCAFEGTSYLYAVYYKTGTAYYEYIFEQEGDTVYRSVDLGIGVPSTVGGVVTGKNTLKGFIVQSTGTIEEVKQTTPFGLRSRLLGWRTGGPE